MSGPVFEFDEASHTYTLDGVVIPSVTQIIKPIGADFSMVPPMVLEAKRVLGVAVHAATELDDLGELDDAETDPLVMGYVRAWRRFLAESRFDVSMNEHRLFHASLRFAGTVDRFGTILDAPWLVDIKTAADPIPSYGVQLAGYEILLRDFAYLETRPIRRATVHLNADGGYRMREYNNPNDAACFRSLLSVHHWKESNK